jgi:ketosteroid isomerase-like protein
MKQLLFIVLIISVVACNQAQSGAKETPIASNPSLDSVQTAINAALDHHSVASNNYDVKACGELFTDDASYINYGAEEIHITGRKQIDSLLVIECGMFKKQQTKFDVKWKTHSLRLSNGAAYQDASVTYTIKSPGREPIDAAADALIAWKKTGTNEWKAHSLIFYSH